MSDKGASSNEVKPNPDPSILTTDQLFRESERIEKLFRAEQEGDRQKNIDRFEAIKHEFELIERYRVEQKNDTKNAVVDALTAAEKAVNKSEVNFNEQSRQQRETTREALKGIETIMNDLKERIVTMEGVRRGGAENRDTQRLDTGTMLALLSLAAFVVFALLNK